MRNTANPRYYRAGCGHRDDFGDDDDGLDHDDGFEDSLDAGAGAGVLGMVLLCGRRRSPSSNYVCKLEKRDATRRGMGTGLHKRGTSFMMTADRLVAM